MGETDWAETSFVFPALTGDEVLVFHEDMVNRVRKQADEAFAALFAVPSELMPAPPLGTLVDVDRVVHIPNELF